MAKTRGPHVIKDYSFESILPFLRENIKVRTNKKARLSNTRSFRLPDFAFKVTPTNAVRYFVLEQKFCCIKCGKPPVKWIVVKTEPNNFLLHLVVEDEQGEDILSIDHIRPKSKGGSNTFFNYQPMCQDCNSAKSSKYTPDSKDIIKITFIVKLKKLLIYQWVLLNDIYYNNVSRLIKRIK